MREGSLICDASKTLGNFCNCKDVRWAVAKIWASLSYPVYSVLATNSGVVEKSKWARLVKIRSESVLVLKWTQNLKLCFQPVTWCWCQPNLIVDSPLTMTHLVDSMIKSVYDLFSVIWIYFFPMLLMFVVAFVSYLFKINNI